MQGTMHLMQWQYHDTVIDEYQGWRQAPYERGPWTPERFETLVLRGPNQF